MVVDSSALLAILLQEPDARAHAEAIEAVEQPIVSAASVIEAGIVLIGREGPGARDALDDLLIAGGFVVVPVDGEQARIALDAFAAYGKGRHAAGLNYGDCFAYALAKATGRPLLYEGGDFAKTDLTAAL